MAAPAPTPGHSRIRKLVSRALVLAILFLGAHPPLHAAKWAPIPAEELADTKPQVDPEAGAEILFRQVIIDHVEIDAFSRTYHVRAKIYSERGLEHFTKIDLPYDNETKIRDIFVRTIKPGGQIVELTKKDIYDREIMKAGKERVKVKSFSPAGVEPGAIVEYAYTEINEGWSWYVSMFFQSSLPARLVRFRFRPIDTSSLATSDALSLNARTLFFNCPDQQMKADEERFYTLEMRNVPAVKDEPFQPPQLNCQSSALFCYSLEKKFTPKAYWENQGKELHERMLKATKPTKLVRTTLDGLIAPGDSDGQKLGKIYDFCRAKLINRYSATATFTREQRAKFNPNETATDTLKTGHGTGEDLNTVFVALARAAGLDARFAAANDRSFILFNGSLTEPFMASDLICAVQLGGQWQYFDPGALYLPFATPYWRNAGTAVIIAAPKAAAPIILDASAPEVSQQKRKATLQLDADGTLEGDISIEYSGHQAVSKKFALDAKTTTERETYIREDVQASLKLAEVTDIKVENAANPLAPLTISFHLRVPEYADRTGSRLFFQPAVFQKNDPPMFPEENRRTLVMFHYRYLDTDDVRITPPEGFELEEASSPGSLELGDMGSYQIVIGVSKKSGAVVYRRKFVLNSIGMPASEYPNARDAFEIIHKRDAHTLTLRRKASSSEPAAPASATAPAETPATSSSASESSAASVNQPASGA